MPRFCKRGGRSTACGESVSFVWCVEYHPASVNWEKLRRFQLVWLEWAAGLAGTKAVAEPGQPTPSRPGSGDRSEINLAGHGTPDSESHRWYLPIMAYWT